MAAKAGQAGHTKLKAVEDEVLRIQKRIHQISEEADVEAAELRDLNTMSIGEAKRGAQRRTWLGNLDPTISIAKNTPIVACSSSILSRKATLAR